MGGLQMPLSQQAAARVLIVEDEPLIALSLEDVLVDAGFRVAGVAGKLERALSVIESGRCDAAIIDTNLAGVSASPVAAALAARGLPFVILSGYSQEQMPSEFAGMPFLQKPCPPARLVETMSRLLLKR